MNSRNDSEFIQMDSPWLDRRPAHWHASKVKRIAAVKLGKMLQPKPRQDDDELVDYLRAASLQWRGLDLSDQKQMWANKKERRQYSLNKGDLIVSEGGDVGRSYLLRRDLEGFIFQNSINRIRLIGQGDIRFLGYWFHAIKHNGWIDIVCNRSTIGHYTAEKVGDTETLSPPPDEQTAIADYLDRETARIDGLIAKEQRLLALLEEKRSALISHAVTKGLPSVASAKEGLDAKVEMKDSGIEWIGEIPRDWEAISLRHCAQLIDCKHKTVNFVSEGYPVVSIQQVHGWEVDLNNTNFTSLPEFNDLADGIRKPEAGDIIYSRNATVGDAALVAEGQEFCMGQDVCLIRCHSLIPKFLLYVLRSKVVLEQLESLMVGSTFRRINVGQIKGFWVALPPDEKQMEIVDYLDTQTTRFDALKEKIHRAIDLLKEKRTALISAAVTGKIEITKGAA